MKKNYLLAMLICLLAMPAFAAVKHDRYISDDNGSALYSYYGSWTPGSPIPGAAEDENFFIGRQRPLIRFSNVNTEVISDDKRHNRKLMWWVPINQTNENGWRSLPSYCFNSEVFNMWSYIDIYGNWTQPFLRNPGAFTDVCHKNGVATEVCSTAAWGVALSSTDGGHGQNYSALANGGADKLMKMFHYYGIDGLGFNSEQSWGMRSAMLTLFKDCHAKRTTYNVPLLHFGMYNLSSALLTSGSGTEFSDFFPYANAFFLNYNWGASTLSSAVTNATSLINSAKSTVSNIGDYVSSYDVYGGADMQGRADAPWTSLQDKAVSIGIWGAHNTNMLYQGSNADGSSAKAIQNCYLRRSEYLFTGGTRNPVNNYTVTNDLNSGSSNFFGYNKLVAAKSTLSWNTNSYFPFITYFNLGNGEFFKNEGETTYDDEWYNIGMQDFLPTWRWWITTSWMGKTTSTVPSDTHACLTYDDAWFGGSCMKVSFDAAVTSGFRFLQLFKTDFPLANTDTWKLRIRYKVLSGNATAMFAMSKVGTETSAVLGTIGKMEGATWQVKEIDVPNSMLGNTMAMLGLRFNAVAAGTEILIGEMALYKANVTYSPVCPDLQVAKILKATSKGVDFKVIWNMPLNGATTATASSEVCTAGGGGAAKPETATRATTLCSVTFGTSSHSERYTNALSITGSNGNTFNSSTIQSGTKKSVYWDKRTEVITLNPGETASVRVTATGSWMTGHIFVDWNNDGDFADTNESVASESSADSSFEGNYSFTVPTTAELGTYTLRYITGWNHTNACSNKGGDNNTLATNGGCVVDYELHVTNGGGAGGSLGSEGTFTGYTANDGRNAWEPVYNDEVGAWYYEIWGQQCGEEPHLITCTTSWAGYAVEAPLNVNGTLSYRCGVRTVAPDGATKSDIQWSSYLECSQLSVIEGITIDKPVIKPDEKFTLSFEDPQHDACDWEIIECSTGTTVATATNVTEFTVAAGLTNLGSYDVKACGKTYPAYIIISPAATGAMPEIYTLVSDKNDIEPNETATVSYTSRNSDGTVSKGLKVGDPYAFTARVNSCLASTASSTEFCKTAPYTYCMWFKATDVIHGTQGTNLLYKTDYTCDWPQNNWGEFWVMMRPEGHSCSTSESSNTGTYKCYANEISFNVVGWDLHDAARAYMTSRCPIEPGSWYHVAVALAANGQETMWLNGKQVAQSSDSFVYGSGCQSGSNCNSGAFTRKFCRLYVGATNVYKAGFNGVIDEIQAWNKVLTTAEVQEAMMGYEKGSAPANLMGYWTFEELVSKTIPSGVGEVDSTFLVYPNWGNGGDFAVAYYSTTPKINDNATTTSTKLYEPMYGDQPDAGCPLISGSYVIETTPTWRTVGGSGSVVKNGNTATAGSATVSSSEETDLFRVYLKLVNSWGASEEKYVDLVVDLHTALENVNNATTMKVYPNPFVENVTIGFADEGTYNLLVWDMNGRCLNVKTVEANKGQVLNFNIEGEKGMYILEIRYNDKVLQAVKMEKK